MFIASNMLCSQTTDPPVSTERGVIKEQLDMINLYYKKAMDMYLKADFSGAINSWQEILKIDPNQTPPQKMIALARERLKKNMETTYKRGKDAYAQGKYQVAIQSYTEYLKYDPNDADTNSMVRKLRGISEIIPDASADTKAMRMVRIGITNFVDPNGDIHLALDALRYAEQLDKKMLSITQIRQLVENENPKITRLSSFDQKKGLIEQRLDEVYNNILEGKYETAVVVCEEILTLEPDNILALTRLGSAHFALGRKDKAKQYWEKVLQYDPKNKDIKRFLNEK